MFTTFTVVGQTLTHRYSFFQEPAGSLVATDLVASANGTLQGNAAITGGRLVLNGASGTYLNLPGGIINNGYSAVTIESWVSFGSLPVNCFFYGFGNTDASGAGENYIFCAPQSGRVAITGVDPGWQGEQNAGSGVDWSGQTNFHLVAVYNPPAGQVALYTNGVLAALNPNAATPLSAVNDVFSYLGRSLYTVDPYAPLSVTEFRIYNGALSPQQVALDAASGPAQIVANPGSLLSVRLQVTGQMLAGTTQTARFYGDFSNVTNVNLATYGIPAFWCDNTNALTVSGTGLVRAIAPGVAANIIATYNGLSATQNVAVTGFVTNGFVADSFGDGFWTIANQANNNVLVANFSGAGQEPFTNAAAEQQFEVLYNLQNGTFRLRQHSSWFCIGALNNTPRAGGAVVLAPIFTGASAQQWYLVDAGGGYWRIFNAASNLVLQAAGGTPPTVTLAAPSGSSAQLWQFTYQTHYPKKGTGGWVGQFGSSWGYDWGYGTGPTLPPSCAYAPMQWGNWNVDTSTYAAWHSTPKPIYLMGFNEPDNSSQANMTPSQAISLWPQLQAMNVPLVSPAMQNTFDSWAFSFFSSIATNNYRVDYSAVHWYASPNAASLLGVLQSVYNTWGRPVWLTEFSPVDWSGTGTWSENDNFNFLAEFMWMAEDQLWLKRYGIFLFSGTPSTNPWDANGHRGDFFLADGNTLTPYGELYAAWDADRTLRARALYFIHNLATSFRLASSNSFNTVRASSIRARDATTQWALLPAPTTNHWYIISLADGRRLNDSLGALALEPVGTVGSTLEWILTGPDSSGYYFIGNASWPHNLNGSGTAPAISFGTVSSTTQNNNTRFRMVKPYQPVSIAAPVVPAALAAVPGDRTVSLSWSNNDRFYNVYRSGVAGGPYARIASAITSPSFVDSNVTNGVAAYYVVSGLNILGEESSYSPEVSARPVSLSPAPLTFTLSPTGVQLAWPPDHTGWELQIQTNPPGVGLGTNWVAVPGSNSTNGFPVPLELTNGSVFFRLSYP